MKNFVHMSLITAQNQYKTCIKPLLDSVSIPCRVRVLSIILLCLTLGVGQMWGTGQAITLSNGSHNGTTNVITWTASNICTITQAPGGGQNETSPSSSYVSAPRWYKYNVITFTAASGIELNSVVVTCTSDGYATTLAGSTYTRTGGTGSVSAAVGTGANTSIVTITCTGTVTAFTIAMGGQARLSAITVNYTTSTPASAYTVTFYKTDGSTQAITEASVGAGVTPPVMSTPCDGWAFQGWSKSQSTSSTSTTVLTTETLTAGKYYPSANTTLYPVYTKAGTASTDLTIVPGSFSSKGSNNYGSGAERTASVDGISFGAHYITGNATNSPASGKTAGTYLQCKASDANIYNKSAFPGSITKVVINQYAAQAFSLYCGSSQLMASDNTSTGQTPSGTAQSAQTAATQMTWNVSAASNYTYFDIKKGSTASYVSSIVVTYLAPVTYYYSYPSCCTELGSINGSFFRYYFLGSFSVILDFDENICFRLVFLYIEKLRTTRNLSPLSFSYLHYVNVHSPFLSSTRLALYLIFDIYNKRQPACCGLPLDL